MQMQPGVYNETAFLGLDTVIYEASRAGLRVIIVLANNWDYCWDWKWVIQSSQQQQGCVVRPYIILCSITCPVLHNSQRKHATSCEQQAKHVSQSVQQKSQVVQVYHAVAGAPMQSSAQLLKTATISSQIL